MPFNLTFPNTPVFEQAEFNVGLDISLNDTYDASIPAGAIDRPSSQDWTVEFWLKSNANPFTPANVIQSFQASNNCWLVFYNGTGNAGINLNGVTATSSNTVNDNVFHHFRVVYLTASTKLILYIDGVCRIVITGTWTKSGTYTNTIGDPVSFQFVAPVIDEITVFSSALSTGTTVGTTYFTPPSAAYIGNESTIIALWHLDGGGLDSANPSVSSEGDSSAFSITFAL